MENIREELVAAARRSGLLEFIIEQYGPDKNARHNLLCEIEKLHNEGTFNFLELLQKGTADQEVNDSFFLLRDIFSKTLPHLDAPIEQVIPCVNHMIKLAGNDMTAGWVALPFKEYEQPNINIYNVIKRDLNFRFQVNNTSLVIW